MTGNEKEDKGIAVIFKHFGIGLQESHLGMFLIALEGLCNAFAMELDDEHHKDWGYDYKTENLSDEDD